MTDKHDPGELPPERQFEMCEQGFHRTFDLLLKNGFDLTHVLCGMLASTLAAISTHGDNVTDEGMAEWLDHFAAYLKSKKSLN